MASGIQYFNPLPIVKGFQDGEQWAFNDAKNEQALQKAEFDLQAQRRKEEQAMQLDPIALQKARDDAARGAALTAAYPGIIADQTLARQLGIIGTQTSQANNAQDRAIRAEQQKGVDEITNQLVKLNPGNDYEAQKVILEQTARTGIWPDGTPLNDRQKSYFITARNQIQGAIDREDSGAQAQSNFQDNIAMNLFKASGGRTAAGGGTGAGGKQYETVDDQMLNDVREMVKKGMPFEEAKKQVQLTFGRPFNPAGAVPVNTTKINGDPFKSQVYPPNTMSMRAIENVTPINATPPAMNQATPYAAVPQASPYSANINGQAWPQFGPIDPNSATGMIANAFSQMPAAPTISFPQNASASQMLYDGIAPLVGNFAGNVQRTFQRFAPVPQQPLQNWPPGAIAYDANGNPIMPTLPNLINIPK